MQRSPYEIIVAFIARQGEVVKIGLCVRGLPIMVPERGEEAVGARTAPIAAGIGEDELLIVLPYVAIDR